MLSVTANVNERVKALVVSTIILVIELRHDQAEVQTSLQSIH